MGYKYKNIFNIFIFSCVVFSFTNAAANAGLGRELEMPHKAPAVSVIWPDGSNLPLGSGTVSEGEKLYHTKCIACHGADGRGGPGGELAGGNPDLKANQPDLTIGTYWPYATTLFDFVRRAMPLNAPWSLSDSEVYALTAYLLNLNGLLPADGTLDANSLRGLTMPNSKGFDGVEISWP